MTDPKVPPFGITFEQWETLGVTMRSELSRVAAHNNVNRSNRPYVLAIEAALDAHDRAIGSLDDAGQPDMLPPGRVEMLLSSLRHYCDANGIDFAEQDRAAYQLYLREKRS